MSRTPAQPTYRQRLAHLAGLVRRMRDAQRRFFDTKDFRDLRAARRLEREVDDLLLDVEQPLLFEIPDE